MLDDLRNAHRALRAAPAGELARFLVSLPADDHAFLETRDGSSVEAFRFRLLDCVPFETPHVDETHVTVGKLRERRPGGRGAVTGACAPAAVD